MDIDQIRFGTKSAAVNKITSSKSRFCLILSLLIAFTSFTAFASSQVKSYTVTDGEKQTEVITVAETAKQIAKDSSLGMDEYDVADFTERDSVAITRRCAVTVSVYGESKQFVTVPATVGEIIAKLGISLGKDDIITPDVDQSISQDSKITVNKVEYKTEKKEEKVNYDKYLELVKEDGKKPDFEKGSYANVTSTYKRKYVNGKKGDAELVDRSYKEIETKSYSALSSVSVLKPEKDIELDKNGVPVNYSKVFKGKGTAYNTKGYTATGRYVKQGYVAVDPSIIPYGSKLYIKSSDNKYIYGYAIAADTGGFTNWGTVLSDLYFDSYEDCIKFGVRDIEIYVLD